MFYFFLRKWVYFCVTKSTKSQQRRASRPPLQTSAHLRECAASSMRAGKVLLLALKQSRRTKKRAFSDIEIRTFSADNSIYLRDFLSPTWAKSRFHLSPWLLLYRACEHSARKNRADSRKWWCVWGVGEKNGDTSAGFCSSHPSVTLRVPPPLLQAKRDRESSRRFYRVQTQAHAKAKPGEPKSRRDFITYTI